MYSLFPAKYWALFTVPTMLLDTSLLERNTSSFCLIEIDGFVVCQAGVPQGSRMGPCSQNRFTIFRHVAWGVLAEKPQQLSTSVRHKYKQNQISIMFFRLQLADIVGHLSGFAKMRVKMLFKLQLWLKYLNQKGCGNNKDLFIVNNFKVMVIIQEADHPSYGQTTS